MACGGQSRVRVQRMTIRKQGAWGLWWLVLITFGIYYLVWYGRINRELFAVLGRPVESDGMWWSQFIPVYGLIGAWRTAKRVNEAHTKVGSPTRIGPFMAAVVSPIWFGSHTRYVQRRVNVLHDVVASHMVRDSGTPAVLDGPETRG